MPESLGDKDPLPTPSDSAALAYSAHHHSGFVLRWLDSTRVVPRRGLIKIDWPLHFQSLVRTLVVVLLAKHVECSLLAPQCTGGRLDGSFPQRPMHPLVP